MTAAGRPGVCQWFTACGMVAVAVVEHPGIGGVPVCRICLEVHVDPVRYPVVARLGDPPPTPAGQVVVGHDVPHLFRGVCICSCGDCTERVGEGLVMCTCPACPQVGCGAKTPTSVGGVR